MAAQHPRSPSTPLPSPTLSRPDSHRRQRLHPKRPLSLKTAIAHLCFPLAPFRPLPLGPAHPSFPATLLAYHLLTEPQLDTLARYYHQAPPTPRTLLHPYYAWPSIWTAAYPAEMQWDDEWLAHVGERKGAEERLRVKRREFGRFIGLRGMEETGEEREEREAWERRRKGGERKVEGMGFWGRRGF